ncbi:DUF72 domain-containing protein [Aneurinibacillus thermoaerophilus]|jgi:uncharacterized protein YecE (DUF72 family)|uniref:DUF72 domain-containing protein n=1 Tax=Aneurinibacillus thermoaerophilus TaxID=143495 RepID=A0A1G8AJJ8_ANETH|nr:MULTISPECIES: DUF72 domain-containing protein [Aneurinibacillus]AMA71506.1 hypothetical protein ACH33_00695 [Aneurinibacillus sp. XH2]MED0675311.1 DUF72 domain-containing protein [Aneurinibacillus thermoaerophilus]MED0678603.1 DUF72 domain-containing protein [Aneurinibacillus thermoaerophilus]MED0756557.1 DUF72 domain-containing protein [Aneurinibacillus thermoaerophilus]MED0760526.1 DUF72 domain-containing protein [Aneurinibacillus thermoaerophilus]
MILIGLTGWGDHDHLYVQKILSRDKLKVYSTHFPIVEVDSSFYAVQPVKNYVKWAEDTPQGFSFIVKAYQGMTGHLRGENPFESIGEMFDAFKNSIVPLREAGKLKAVLFQYPPWFDCTRKNVDILRYTKDKMEDIPVALEFRHQSWFAPKMRERTLAFMEKDGWIHSICDEPQAGVGSVPTVLHATDRNVTIVRFHGRNAAGWHSSGQPNWREVRYLYRYSTEELKEWKEKLELLQKQTKEICVIFNNNSGGDAADNAKELMELLGVEYDWLGPRQLKFF